MNIVDVVEAMMGVPRLRLTVGARRQVLGVEFVTACVRQQPDSFGPRHQGQSLGLSVKCNFSRIIFDSPAGETTNVVTDSSMRTSISAFEIDCDAPPASDGKIRLSGRLEAWVRRIFAVLSRRLAIQAFENHTHVFGMFKT